MKRTNVTKSVQEFNLAKYKTNIQIHKLSLGILNYESLKMPYKSARTEDHVAIEKNLLETKNKNFNIFEFFNIPFCKINFIKGIEAGNNKNRFFFL